VSNNKPKKRAPLNRTLSLTPAEIAKFDKQLIRLSKQSSVKSIKNKIINQDLFEIIDFLPDRFVDLLFIDPPYNLSKKYNEKIFSEMDKSEYENWIDSWLSKLVRILKPTASIYICSDWKSSTAIVSTASKYFKLQNRITWEREKGRGAKKNWKNCIEDIWFFTVSDDYTFNLDDVKLRRKVLAPYTDMNGKPKDWLKGENKNYRDTFPSNIWTDISIPFWSMPENTDHPTQKPEKLLAKIILAATNTNDYIFDPFAGSGTTAVVAKKLGRNYCCAEIDNYFCCLAEKRLSIAEKDKSIQGYSDKVFWERNTFSEQMKLIAEKKSSISRKK
jgi:DNA modification methylase